MIYDTCYNIVIKIMSLKILTPCSQETMRILTINSPVSEEEFISKTEDEILEITYINVLKITKLNLKIFLKLFSHK